MSDSQDQYNFETVAIEYSSDSSHNIGTARNDVYQYIVKAHLRKLLPTAALKNVKIKREADGSNTILVKGLTGDKMMRQRLTDLSNKMIDNIEFTLKDMQIISIHLGVKNLKEYHKSRHDEEIQEIESPSKRSKSTYTNKASGLLARSKLKKKKLFTGGPSIATSIVSSSSSAVSVPQSLENKQSHVAVSRPAVVAPSPAKQKVDQDSFREIFEVEDDDDDEVVLLEYQASPSNLSKRYAVDAYGTRATGGEISPSVVAISSPAQLDDNVGIDIATEDGKEWETDAVNQLQNETLLKVSNFIREAMTKVTEDETERLKLEAALRQRIAVLEGELKREQLARQLAERLLTAASPREDPPEAQQRILNIERKLEKEKLEKENMRTLIKAFAEQMSDL